MGRQSLLKGGFLAATTLALGLNSSVAMAQNVTLRMSTWLPPKHHLVADTLKVWFAQIEKASGGTLKIKLDPAPIAKPPA
ncbi:MAG: hypothetical protein WBD34_22815, partial [Burkholderiaceae bacterium]